MIVGFTRSKAAGGLAALLLADPSAGGLTFAGKVGTGFSFREADELHALLRSTASSEPVVIVPHEVSREKPTWVEPKLMARVGHSGRGSNGFLRHSVYRGTGIALFCPGSALGQQVGLVLIVAVMRSVPCRLKTS